MAKKLNAKVVKNFSEETDIKKEVKDISDDFGTPTSSHKEDVDFKKDDLNDEFNGASDGKKEDGEESHKPFYQKWWFWVVLVGVLAVAAVTAYNAYHGTHLGQETTTAVVEESSSTSTTTEAAVIPAGAIVMKGDKGWGLYNGGQLVSNYNGLAENELGTWYLQNGLVDFDYTGSVVYDGVTYRIEGGKVVNASTDNTTTGNQNDNDFPAFDSSGETVAQASASPAGTESQEQALRAANNYLSETSYSREWLIAQVKSDGFSEDDAAWAADNSGADWNEQAYLKAKEYLDLTSFDHDSLVNQLVFEGFSQSQAEYGAKKAGV